MPFLKIITKNKLGKCKHILPCDGFPLLASFITNPRVRAGTAGLNLLHSSTHTTKNITMGSQSPPESVYVVTNSA